MSGPSLPGIPTRLVVKYRVPAGAGAEECGVMVASLLMDEHRISSVHDMNLQAVFMVGRFYSERQPDEDGQIVMLSLPTVLLYDFMEWIMEPDEEENEDGTAES